MRRAFVNFYTKCVIFTILLIVFYMCFLNNFVAQVPAKYDGSIQFSSEDSTIPICNGTKANYNIWMIFTNMHSKHRFIGLIRNLLNVSSVPLKFHVIVDDTSMKIALLEFGRISYSIAGEFSYFLYHIDDVVNHIQDISLVFAPHFSPDQGSYQSAIFYFSIGLYRFAPLNQESAIVLKGNLYFKEDVALLFKEFSRFKPSALLGLSPELSPVYRTVLKEYRTKHDTSFGEFYHPSNISFGKHPRGFQGYNSGVVLLNLDKIRRSEKFLKLLSQESLRNFTTKYMVKGHLGDQDFYTLLGFEHPELVQTLNCGFNRQLCTWWRDNGYEGVFEQYFKCDHKVVVLHGNCNANIS